MKTVLSESAGLTHEASLEFLVPKIQPVPLLRLLFNEPLWFLLQRLQVCSPLILSPWMDYYEAYSYQLGACYAH